MDRQSEEQTDGRIAKSTFPAEQETKDVGESVGRRPRRLGEPMSVVGSGF